MASWVSGVENKLEPEQSGYMLLHVSADTFDEISRKIVEAGKPHAFQYDGRLIDLYGCALVREAKCEQT